MKTATLNQLKKELQELSQPELTALILRMARHKKESKELLHFLVFEASDVETYLNQVREELSSHFVQLGKSPYTNLKIVRKIFRLMNRYIKYTADKASEAEMLIWTSGALLDHPQNLKKQKAVAQFLDKQLQKAEALLPKLHEDLQFDRQQELEQVRKKLKHETWFL